MLASGREAGLVERFARFSMQLLNERMQSFFTRNMHLFDQEIDDINEKGETIQQYECFIEYEKILEREMSAFITEERFNNQVVFLTEIQRLVAEDKERMKRQLEEMLATLTALMSAEGDGAEEAKIAAPLVMFFKPQGLSELLDTVLSLTKYETFSALMRARVAQQKLIDAIMEVTELVAEELGMGTKNIVNEADIEVEDCDDDFIN